MRIRIKRKGILFLTFVTLLIVIIVLAIIFSIRSCSSSSASVADNYADSLANDSLAFAGFNADSILAVQQTKDSVVVHDKQNWLEELMFHDMHESLYGIDVSGFEIENSQIENGQTFSRLMNEKYNVNIAVINALIEKSKGIFDMRDLRGGKPTTAFIKQDTSSAGKLEYLVYEKSASEYIIFGAGDSIFVRKDQKEVSSQERYVEGEIVSSLWQALDDNGINPILASRLEEIYKWTIDFFAIQKGDRFRVIYEERFIDTVSVGIGRIFGAEFTHNGKPYMAISFEQKNQNGEIENGYWDELGKNLRKNILRAPLSFSARISSRFGMRTHPITRRRKAHNGIDYAAPSGTPVLCVADGTVTAKGWDGGGGGNRLWIRHAQGLESGYLHLRGYASGISVGSRVRQGQVIGYVGSTGVSTGPHLDYRIRKLGKYIDPTKVPSTPTDPIKEANKGAFNKMKSDVVDVLDQYAKKR